MEDDRVAILESQLAQAKQIAEEADKKYEEVREGHNNCALYFRWRSRCPSCCCLHGYMVPMLVVGCGV